MEDAEQSGEQVLLKDGAKDVEMSDAVVDDANIVDDVKIVDDANTVEDAKVVDDDVKKAGKDASGDSGVEDTDKKLRTVM